MIKIPIYEETMDIVSKKYFFKQLWIDFTWDEIKYLKKKKSSFKIHAHKLN